MIPDLLWEQKKNQGGSLKWQVMLLTMGQLEGFKNKVFTLACLLTAFFVIPLQSEHIL